MPECWVPYRRHAATFLIACVPLVVASAVGAAAGSTGWTIAPLAVAVTPVIVAGVLWLVCLGWDRKLAALAADGDLLLDWTYEEEQWRRHVERAERKGRIVPLVLGLGLLGVGLTVSFIAAAEGNFYYGSLLLTWVLPLGIAGAAGLFAAWLVRWNFVSTSRERLRRGGRLLLGPAGFYLTGEYRPLRGFGQRLTGIRIEEPDETGETRLVFTWFVSSGRYSNHQDVIVPVPPGREEEARAAVAVLTAED